ncbi:hypothetical protein LOK49_LG05G01287 [Camellia lanceoleosa]|uniref:Uncharacterized protein n=1 Tax=Camellia lanceoleosa TaxID=1840588 RepID=A0ACC0HM04_9ERIC|nr:hypothetical protein LOK49_LG05G01287 [Camellia lanceoleosa]
MANPHNWHDTLANESWQAIFNNNNTGLPSDIIATTTDERGSQDESMESLCRRSDHKEKTPWSVEEVLKLIVGVLSTTKPGRQKRWQEIVEKYFKKERTEEKLKQKWKDLMKHATKKTDGEQRLFYMMAAIVEVRIQPDKQNVFEKVIQEWYVTSEIGLRLARDWLNSVKNLELQHQLNEIKNHVIVAELSDAYKKIRYWRNPSLMN